MYSAATVLVSESASTSASFRQCGATYASARRRSLSSRDKILSRRRRARRRDQDDVRLIGAEVHLAEVAEVLGGIAIDRAAGDVDVQLIAVRADDEPHARPPREFHLAEHTAR